MGTRCNIGCATDKNYAQHLGIMIYSLLVNTKTPTNFDFYIVDGGISNEDIKRFEEIQKQFNCKMYFLKPDRKYFEKLKVYEIYSEATYYRYFLMDTTAVEKMLFLDCDMIVEGDVSELYETTLNGNILSAVFDPLVPKKHLEKLKLESYFNAGLFLVDCKRWQKEKISQRAYQFQLENEKMLEFPDQDSLNIVLKNNWQMLSFKWNVLAKVGLVKYGLGNLNCKYASKKEIIEIFNNPQIIHYANRLFKPWNYLDPTPYKKNYLHYKNLSPWSSVPQFGNSALGIISRLSFYVSFTLKYFFRNFK
ncbi:MAG: glycosyltransferase family 8 protein [Bacteroidetes bacterium]|nr:glycosyltransferase family 8 protein [Bacteroidota bacterium]